MSAAHPLRERRTTMLEDLQRNVPHELRELSAWLLFRLEPKAGKPSEWDKVPYYAGGTKRRGRQGSLEDAQQLVEFATAMQALNGPRGSWFDGVGFALLPCHSVTAIDLDKLDADPMRSELASAVLDSGSYVEASPSGNGRRAFFKGKAGFGNVKNHLAGVEVFESAGFVTVTGAELSKGADLAPMPETLRERLAIVLSTPKDRRASTLRPQIGKFDLGRLPAALREKIKAGFPSGTTDRSAALYWRAHELRRAKLTEQETLDVLGDPDLPWITPALERRGGDVSSALDWLWRYCVEPVYAKDFESSGSVDSAGMVSGLADTDIANARRLIDRHGQDLRYTPERGWLVWDGRRWAMDEKSLSVLQLAKVTALEIFDEIKGANERDRLFQHAKRSQSRNAVQAMEWLARSECPVSITEFDQDPMLLNVINGTVDLRTGRLRQHARDDLISKLAPVEYDQTAECPIWHGTLQRIFAKDEKLIAYVQRLVGYALTGATVEQAIHFLWGTGANGKSTVSEVIQDMLGDYATVCSPDLIMARRYSGIPNDVARLRGVRLAMMNETDQGSRFDEAKLKDLTGGDRLTARFLHQEYFDFRPTHKLIIRGNHKPAITGTDEGIWRRLRLIPFTVVIPAEERDPYLLDKLRGEMAGVLRWAVDGCLQWQKIGLQPPEAVSGAVKAYRDEADTLGRFITENCSVRNLAQVKASAFQRAYTEFCRQAEERPIPSKDLPTELQRRGFEYQRTKAARLYIGLELSTEAGWRGMPGDRW